MTRRIKSKKKDKKRSLSLSKMGLVTLLLTIFATALYVVWTGYKSSIPVNQGNDNVNEETGELPWETHFDKFEGFVISYPQLLSPYVVEEPSPYKYFIRFEEIEFSQGKGIALGIRRNNLESEAAEIRSEISEAFGGKDPLEYEKSMGKWQGIVLEYAVEEESDLESRSVFVLEHGGMAYSISTTPEQLDRVVGSFDVLKEE